MDRRYPGWVPRRLPVVLLYLGLALVVTWPLALHMGDSTVGFPGVDGSDTATLRGLIADWLMHPVFRDGRGISDGVYFPVGYPVFGLTPNLLDHLTGAPLVWLLPFPWSDNCWWIAALTLAGYAAHRLGREAGGSEGAGFLVGVALLTSEATAREVNLHHAPQSLIFWGPLTLEAALRLRRAPQLRTAALAGLWLAGAALSYWYYGLFLAAGAMLVLLWGRGAEGEPGRPPLKLLLVIGAVAAALCLPALAPLLLGWAEGPVTSGGRVPPPVSLPDSYGAVPEALRFVAQHGNDLLFWLRTTPWDTSNRVSLVLLVAVALAGRREIPDRGARRGLWAMAGLGAVMLLGPYLRWGDQLALVSDQAIPLPFRWLGQIHPFLARLTWPERWGVIVPLALATLAARAPRPGLLAVAVGLEALIVSGNLPVQLTSVRFERCWSALSVASGAILELPLARSALDAPRVGVHRRFHGRPLVNPILLPPGARPPESWRAWSDEQPLLTYLLAFEAGKWPSDPGAEAVRQLRQAGVSALAVDAEPGALLSAAKIARYRAGLGKHLGQPIDLGCALVWWLDGHVAPPAGLADGDGWREDASAWKAAHPAITPSTLMAAHGPEGPALPEAR